MDNTVIPYQDTSDSSEDNNSSDDESVIRTGLLPLWSYSRHLNKSFDASS